MATARVAPISPDCSDSDLVAAVRRGSDAAFEELYARYSRRIGGYVRGMVGDHGRAEDITQEIFISALRRMRGTNRPIAFKPWIHEIAKNACIDSFRRARRAQEVSLDADEGLSTADRRRLTVVATPDAVFDSKQAIHDLRGAFGGLSDSHHEILVLRELEGRSYRDIGERLGMTLPVVESTLFRARRRLAEEYDELASGRRCEFVRKMVDSGPHYSLGIRDRRRIARHLTHCQPCRGHARSVNFDAAILNMPRAASIAALLPIPMLRLGWGALERLGVHRLALRSAHTLARSSDQIVGAGPGAGRSAATAAVLVIAGVGSGIVTANYALPTKPPLHGAVVHATTYAPQGTAAVPGVGTVARRVYAPRTSERAAKASLPSTHDAGSSSLVGVGDPRPADNAPARPATPVPPRAASPPPATSGAPKAIGTPDVQGTSSGGSSASAGTSESASTTTVSAPVQTATPTPPAAAPGSTGTLTGVLGTVLGAIPQPPTSSGGSTGSTATGSLAGTLSSVTSGLSQLLGQ